MSTMTIANAWQIAQGASIAGSRDLGRAYVGPSAMSALERRREATAHLSSDTMVIALRDGASSDLCPTEGLHSSAIGVAIERTLSTGEANAFRTGAVVDDSTLWDEATDDWSSEHIEATLTETKPHVDGWRMTARLNRRAYRALHMSDAVDTCRVFSPKADGTYRKRTWLRSARLMRLAHLAQAGSLDETLMGVIRRASTVDVPYFGSYGLGGLVMGTTPHVSLSDMALVAVREALAVPASRTKEGERSRKARQRAEATGDLLELDKAIRALDAKVQRAQKAGRDAQDAMEERAVRRAERQAMLKAQGVLVTS